MSKNFHKLIHFLKKEGVRKTLIKISSVAYIKINFLFNFKFSSTNIKILGYLKQYIIYNPKKLNILLFGTQFRKTRYRTLDGYSFVPSNLKSYSNPINFQENIRNLDDFTRDITQNKTLSLYFACDQLSIKHVELFDKFIIQFKVCIISNQEDLDYYHDNNNLNKPDFILLNIILKDKAVDKDFGSNVFLYDNNTFDNSVRNIQNFIKEAEADPIINDFYTNIKFPRIFKKLLKQDFLTSNDIEKNLLCKQDHLKILKLSSKKILIDGKLWDRE